MRLSFATGNPRCLRHGLQHEELAQRSQVLLDLEQQQRDAIAHARNSIIIVQDGVIRYANPPFLQMCGLPGEKVIGQMLDNLLVVGEQGDDSLPITIPKANMVGYLRTKEGQQPVQISAFTTSFNQQLSQLMIIRDLSRQQAFQQGLQRLAALNRIARAISATLDVETLLATVHEELVSLFEPDAFFFAFYDEEEKIIDYRYLIDEGKREAPIRVPLNEGLTAQVIKSKKPVLLRTQEELNERYPQIDRWGTQKVPDSWLGVPMLRGERLIGVLCVQKYQPFAYDEKQQDLLFTIADQVAVASENARLYALAQEEIAQRRAAEETLRAYTEDLESLVEERTRALRQAQEKALRQEKLALVGRMAASISHELRNPLGVITNAIYYLKMILQSDNPKVHEYLTLIEEQARKASHIAGGLLDFSRPQPPQPATLHLSDFLPRVLRSVAPPANVDLQLDLAGNLPPVFFDPTHLEQILTNLLSNAYQAMPTGGVVTLRARRVADGVQLSVQDTGEGMNEEVLQQIFEPLFTTKARGIGLGLAITRHLVEANKARITVESTAGAGSTFTLLLPLAPTT